MIYSCEGLIFDPRSDQFTMKLSRLKKISGFVGYSRCSDYQAIRLLKSLHVASMRGGLGVSIHLASSLVPVHVSYHPELALIDELRESNLVLGGFLVDISLAVVGLFVDLVSHSVEGSLGAGADIGVGIFGNILVCFFRGSGAGALQGLLDVVGSVLDGIHCE